MRLVVITGTAAERDAVLEAFPPARLARLRPYPETRVAEAGAGTLVVVPAGPGEAAAAVAAAVALNRLTPDAVVVAGLRPGAGGVLAGGDPLVVGRLTAALPGAGSVPMAGPTAEGVLAAAAVHGVRAGMLLAPDLAGLRAASTTAFRGEWGPLPAAT